jgi:hypothetical protein
MIHLLKIVYFMLKKEFLLNIKKNRKKTAQDYMP